MADATDVLALIRADDRRMAALETVRALALPQWWVAAGFVRNAVWDAMYGVSTHRADEDIDVVYFDALRDDEASEKRIDATLRALMAEPWSAKNQARMHRARGNAFAPFTSTADGMAHWVETTAPIGVRIDDDGALTLLAVYGIDDLLDGVLRPTPAFAGDRVAQFHERVSAKAWLERWPALRLDLTPPPSGMPPLYHSA